MRTGLIVDAGCDLPQATLDQYKIRVAPIQIRVKDRLWTDDRNPATTAEFYATVFAPGGGASDAESFATTVDEFNALLLAAATTTDDYTFIQCISRSRSPIYTNANEACGQALRTVQRARFAVGVKGPFAARALNSQTLFAGQGALAITSAQLMADAKSPATADRLEALAARTYAYAVPRDLKYLYERGAKRGDKSVGLMAVTVGGMLDVKPVLMGHGNETKPVAKIRKWDAAAMSMLNLVMREINAGHLLSNTVVISYGGAVTEAEALPSVVAFKALAASKGVEVLVCVMSMAAAINMGPRALSVGFIGQAHTFG